MITLRWPARFALFISTQELLPHAESKAFQSVEGRGNCCKLTHHCGKYVGSEKGALILCLEALLHFWQMALPFPCTSPRYSGLQIDLGGRGSPTFFAKDCSPGLAFRAAHGLFVVPFLTGRLARGWGWQGKKGREASKPLTDKGPFVNGAGESPRCCGFLLWDDPICYSTKRASLKRLPKDGCGRRS